MKLLHALATCLLLLVCSPASAGTAPCSGSPRAWLTTQVCKRAMFRAVARGDLSAAIATGLGDPQPRPAAAAAAAAAAQRRGPSWWFILTADTYPNFGAGVAVDQGRKVGGYTQCQIELNNAVNAGFGGRCVRGRPEWLTPEQWNAHHGRD